MKFYKLLVVFGLFHNHIGALLNNNNINNNTNNRELLSNLKILTLKLNHSTNHNHNYSVNKTNNISSNSSGSDKLKYPGSGCPTCENQNSLNQNELIRLRIEFEKNQILKKLRLKERPHKIHGHHNHSFIPRSLMDGLNYNGELLDNSNLDEDYYAKTTQKVIFPNEDIQCRNLIGRIFYTNCYKFELTQKNDEDEITVNLAELWFYISIPGRHSYAIKQLNSDNLTKSLIGVYSRLRINNLNSGEWGKIDLKHAITKNGSYIINQFIEIECMTCDQQATDKYDYKPFIVIDIKPNRSNLHRKKRSLDCSSTDGIECCRETLNITFADIGWDDWIIFPASYNAYYCKGSCSTAASVTLSGAHNQVIRKLRKNRKTKGTRNLELIPCCTASKYSSLQLIYMDSNKSAIHKVLPNMVVEECGCN